MKFKDKLGNFNEATVDIEKILLAKEFMTRKMKCPVYGTSRYFYRFCDEIPFSNENFKRLKDALSGTGKRSSPKDLRTLSQDDVHSRAEKFIEIAELENWLESGYNYGSILREKFHVQCAEKGKNTVLSYFLTL